MNSFGLTYEQWALGLALVLGGLGGWGLQQGWRLWRSWRRRRARWFQPYPGLEHAVDKHSIRRDS